MSRGGTRPVCSVGDCLKLNDSRGYCSAHYKKWQTYGDPLGRYTYTKHFNTKHGMTDSREWSSWKAMRDRCTKPDHIYYQYYGGRGITVCPQWATSFEQFYKDMGARPASTSLDRIDTEGNYEPGNCRWASATEQARNRRLNKLNKAGVTGIRYRHYPAKPNSDNWEAYINVNKRQLRLGGFKTKSEAIAARKAAERKYWAEPNHDLDLTEHARTTSYIEAGDGV